MSRAREISKQPNGSDLPMFACRAWVNFDGTGTPAIRASGNVSSITDHGAGDYTINFTTAMPDANYVVVGTTNNTTATAGTSGTFVVTLDSTVPQTASSVRIKVHRSGSAFVDCTYVCVAIFR